MKYLVFISLFLIFLLNSCATSNIVDSKLYKPYKQEFKSILIIFDFRTDESTRKPYYAKQMVYKSLNYLHNIFTNSKIQVDTLNLKDQEFSLDNNGNNYEGEIRKLNPEVILIIKLFSIIHRSSGDECQFNITFIENKSNDKIYKSVIEFPPPFTNSDNDTFKDFCDLIIKAHPINSYFIL